MTRILETLAAPIVIAALLLPGQSALDARGSAGKEKAETSACGPRVWIEYTDDDPDYFIIKNRSASGWTLEMIAFDLSQSAGRLVFDPDVGGPGVGGSAEFVPDSQTSIRLVGTVPAQDGGTTLSLQFQNFAESRDYTFHIDLDATHSDGSRTWVLPADMAGTRALAAFRGPTGQIDKLDAVFDANAEADSGAGGCV